ncbi:GTP-binding protein [Solimonas marina]|uniref:GTP-binding protein n=1 Tax=Solimonas marina TaxID=2714601 RepID=A0A969W7B1_9GAMM|nr:ATP/GTP-binding protein [Solimonas marina]NKF20808.1 GTP-binding protein [Solimonas marina]
MSREYKLLFAGPMGAGKTTAIGAISDHAPIATEALNSDLAQHSKTHTTVGFDYGEVALDGGDRLRLYGMPGQSRFDFVWKVASEGALGVVLLADNTRPDPLADLAVYVEAFRPLADADAMVIGIGRSQQGTTSIDDYAHWLSERGHAAPVFSVDVRRRDDVLLLLEALLSQIETRELFATSSQP